MKNCRRLLFLCGFMPLAAMSFPTIWTGPAIVESDATQPDQMTADVWIMRGTTFGIYNSALESGFTHYYSPSNTEWADGTTANCFTLSYTNWNYWAKNIHGGPPSTVGVPAVVHLISDDIYIDITFTSWSITGGGYQYQRSTPAVAGTPPWVTVTNPVPGAVFAAPANVVVAAAVANTSGTVTNVQFLVGSSILTNETSAPCAATAANLAAGSYLLSAIATDNNGLSATNSVSISVVSPVPINLASPVWSSPSRFQFNYSANPGLQYVVQRSTNLITSAWLPIATNTAAASPVTFTDTTATASQQFYRVARLPNP